jgi:hypothetical protein
MSRYRILYWTPRALSVAFTLLIVSFALDVFSEGYAFWKTLAALVIHLVPALIILAVLLVAWRWEWVGAAVFAALGGFYAAAEWRHPNWVSLVCTPLFVIAVLFYLSWRIRLPGRRTGGS